MISILILSWERHDLLRQTLEHNLNNVGYDYELLVCDQGSLDPRNIPLIELYEPSYFRKNSRNEGVGHAFNQLYLRSRGDYIMLMANDLLLPHAWGSQMINFINKIPNPGICAIDWGHHGLPNLQNKFAIYAHWLTPERNRCFGPMMFRRYLVEQVGLFYEGYDKYGIEDSDLNERVNLAGFNSFYIPGLRAEHLGVGTNDLGIYRKQKDESLLNNTALFNYRMTRWNHDGLKCDLPPMKEPV